MSGLNAHIPLLPLALGIRGLEASPGVHAEVAPVTPAALRLPQDEEPFNPDYVEVDRILDESHSIDKDNGEVGWCFGREGFGVESSRRALPCHSILGIGGKMGLVVAVKQMCLPVL